MKLATALLVGCLAAMPADAANKAPLNGFILAGEPIAFHGSTPVFSARQIRQTDEATREGFTLWASTDFGRMLVRQLDRPDYQILLSEDTAERGMGRAPQPSIGTMTRAGDRTRLKVYQAIVNPAMARLPDGGRRVFRQPGTAAEMMAVAWAGEMLHVYFYSKGIVLPHHERPDFQRDWTEVARQLGFPYLEHDHR